MTEVLIDVEKVASQLAQKLGPSLVQEISKRQKGAGGGNESGGQGGNSNKPGYADKNKKKKESVTDKTVGAYKEGEGAIGLEQDSSELRSGRFSGIIGRKIDSAKKIKDKIQEQREKRAEKYGDPKSGDPSQPQMPGGSPGSVNDKTKYNILEVKEARIMNLHTKGGMGGSGSFGGGSAPGKNGGPGDSGGNPPGGVPPGGDDKKSGALGKISSAIAPLAMGMGAIIGAGVGIISSMAGMHQQAMQSQEGTLGAFGGYASGGGGIVRNSEVGQLSISRARVLGGSAAGQDFDTQGSKLGAQFGVTQGIGGTAGAEMFAKMNKFGGFQENESGLKKIMSDGIRSGFTGLRQAEFMQQVSGISENAYNSGMGIQSTDQVSGTLSNLRGAGIRDNRLGSVYGAMNDNMTKEGGQMNSMLVAHHMQQNGGDYLAAMASAEEGMGSAGNTSAINQMTQGMDPKTKAIWLKKQGIITATEGNESVRLGKDVMDVSGRTSTADSAATYGEAAANQVSGYGGQRHIEHANALDQEAALGEAFNTANDLQDQIFKMMIDRIKDLNGIVTDLKALF